MTLEFGSARRFDFVVRDSGGNEIWRWSDGRMFTLAVGFETLEPGGERVYEATLGEGPATPGLYQVEGLLTARAREMSAGLTVRVE